MAAHIECGKATNDEPFQWNANRRNVKRDKITKGEVVDAIDNVDDHHDHPMQFTTTQTLTHIAVHRTVAKTKWLKIFNGNSCLVDVHLQFTHIVLSFRVAPYWRSSPSVLLRANGLTQLSFLLQSNRKITIKRKTKGKPIPLPSRNWY